MRTGNDASGVDGVPDVTLDDIVAAGRAWCARPWSEVAGRYTASYCFSSAYIVELLGACKCSRSLCVFFRRSSKESGCTDGVAHDSAQVSYSRKLFGYSVEWSLGAQLFYAQESTGVGVGLHPQGTANGCPAAGGDESGGLMWAVVGLALGAGGAVGCMLLTRRKEAAGVKEAVRLRSPMEDKHGDDGIYSGPV